MVHFGEGKLHTRELDTEPGTRANKHKGHRRAHLVLKVRMLPLFMFCFDGATTLAMTGVSLRSKACDPFSDELSADMGNFQDVAVLRAGQSLTDLSEKLSPGCSRPGHKDHWMIAYLVGLNRHSCHSQLQATTREPKRQSPPQMQTFNRELGRALATPADGWTDTRQQYENVDIRNLGYTHDGWRPGINGDEAAAARRVLPSDTLVRVPRMVTHFQRPLEKAAWAPEPAVVESVHQYLSSEQAGSELCRNLTPRGVHQHQ